MFRDPSHQKTLYTWGNGLQGQLGLGTEQSVGIPAPVQVLLDEDIVYVSASGDISAIVTADGKIYTWGRTKVSSYVKA
jgi:hypothetical protein